MDDAQEEAEGAGLTLPQPLWDALERLQCVEDRTGLCGRLQYREQLANTASGGVFAAVLDGDKDVAVKVKSFHPQVKPWLASSIVRQQQNHRSSLPSALSRSEH